MNTPTTKDIEKAIEHIKSAITMVVDGELASLSYDQEIWNNGIHLFQDSDIPFDVSFDEICFSELSEKKYNKLQAELIIWLGSCLAMAYQGLKQSKKITKAKTVCLRFVKAGNITVDVPKNWDKMTDNEKGIWANETLDNTDTEILLDSIRDDEDNQCEAIENVENGYTADVPHTTLWKAYRNEVE